MLKSEKLTDVKNFRKTNFYTEIVWASVSPDFDWFVVSPFALVLCPLEPNIEPLYESLRIKIHISIGTPIYMKSENV